MTSQIELGKLVSINFVLMNLVAGNWSTAAAVIYCHMYSHQYVEYLEVDLMGSKATNRKQEKIIFNFSCLRQGFNRGLLN